ncbi:hypothetical protein Erwinia_phage_Pastis_00096 [Erwinia phage Pastis]|nr:hypothetical protein Erwinia_phage_Pastis_00096 [Erwinia phage Pastis]
MPTPADTLLANAPQGEVRQMTLLDILKQTQPGQGTRAMLVHASHEQVFVISWGTLVFLGKL